MAKAVPIDVLPVFCIDATKIRRRRDAAHALPPAAASTSCVAFARQESSIEPALWGQPKPFGHAAAVLSVMLYGRSVLA